MTYRLLLINSLPKWSEEFASRRTAVKHAQALIVNGLARMVVLYHGEKAQQLLVHRPSDYVHIERI